MALIEISVDVTGIIPAGGVSPSVFPNLAHAIQRLAETGHSQWQEYAAGKPLPDGKTINARSGNYLRSIRIESDGELGQRVFSDAPYAKAIEEGVGQRDLKDMLRTSIKTRRTADGRLYLIIPFRWGTPGTVGFGRGNTMSEEGHALARELSPSRVIGTGSRLSASGHTVPQNRYRWGGRLTKDALAAGGVHGREAKRMRGMVKFQGDREGSRDTQYLTFRTMIEGSSGWISPPRAGSWPARTVAEQLKKIAPEILQAAAAADYRAAAREAAT